MKVRTNLTSEELELVAKGLKRLSESNTDGHFIPENPAEKDLMDEVTTALELSSSQLAAEISKLFIEE